MIPTHITWSSWGPLLFFLFLFLSHSSKQQTAGVWTTTRTRTSTSTHWQGVFGLGAWVGLGWLFHRLLDGAVIVMLRARATVRYIGRFLLWSTGFHAHRFFLVFGIPWFCFVVLSYAYVRTLSTLSTDIYLLLMLSGFELW